MANGQKHAVIRHNTYTIKWIDAKACVLFRCDHDWLIGRNLLDLIADPDLRRLAKVRLEHIRTKGELKTQPLPLMRPDGSVFWARIQTHKIGEGMFESSVVYDGEN